MASAVDWSGLSGIKAENDDLVTIEATCPTGCEPALLLEIKSKFGDEVVATKHQGRVFFDLQIQAVDQVLDLRIVDNAYVIFDVIPEFDFPSEGQECLDKLIALIHHSFQWEKGLKAWNIIHKFYPTYDHLLKGMLICEYLTDKNSSSFLRLENFGSQQHAEKKLRTDEDIKVLNFRCTCYRSGKNYHPFGSMDVQKAVGGAIQDKFQWGVKMKDSDVDVTLNIDLKQVYSCIKLTKDSLFKRNIEHFGPTTLRATICAGMLKYANVQPGDVVLDPMCGGGSIPLEGCLSDKKAFYFGGEIHEKAVSRCAGNMSALSTKSLSIGTDFVQWDVRRIPMKDNSVDVFVTDLVRSILAVRNSDDVHCTLF